MKKSGKEKHYAGRWMVAVLLGVCLIITLLPVEYYGISIPCEGESDAAAQWEIVSFSELPSYVRLQTVETETAPEELNLPNTLRAVCRPIEEDKSETPDTEAPDTEQPDTEETEQPETPDTETPDTETPDTEETEQPETPDTEASEPEQPDTEETPDTEASEPEQPDTEETEQPETPDTEASEPEQPDTEETPDTEAAGPEQPDTETAEPETGTATSTVAPVEEGAADEALRVETATVTIKENYALPQRNTGFKKLSLTGQASSEEMRIIEGVSWSSSPEYDGSREGTYIFTPILPAGYRQAEGAAVPQISVTVEEPSEDREIMLLAMDDTELLPECGIVSEDTVWTEGTLENGTLVVEPGVTLTLNGVLTIKGSVTISGGGQIVRGNADACLLVNAGANLTASGITFDGGPASGHSMLEVNTGAVTLGDGCRLINCTKNAEDSGGAALRVSRGTAVLNNAEISNCSSVLKGGAIQAIASDVTINGGTYSGNRTTGENAWGGGFIYNDTSKLTVNGGSFTGNSSTGRGGCIYHGGTNGTETLLYGGSFQGNTSSYPGNEGSGAVWNSSVSSGAATLALSGAVRFGGDEASGADGIYLDQQNDTPRKIYICGALSSQVNIFLSASEGYVIAEGKDYSLQERDMKKIHFVDTGNSGKTWYAVLDSEQNQLHISEADPDYKLYVYYDGNGAEGEVTDAASYESGDFVTVKSDEGLSYDGRYFVGWNTKPDGSGDLYTAGESIQITDDITLYAIFAKSLTGTFYSGAAGSSQEVVGSTANGIITTPELVEMEGFTSVGWDRSPVGYTGGIQAGGAFVLDGDVSFYGVYKKPVTVSYDANGGTAVPGDKIGYLYASVNETEISFLLPEFTLNSTVTREGYTLNGWTSSPDGTGTLYKAGSAQEFDSDITLYANWVANDSAVYTVEHYKQTVDGSGYIKEDADTQNLAASAGTTVTAEPKEYDGFTENSEHPQKAASGVVAADGSLTLKLYYDRDVYQIDFDLNEGDGTPPAPQTVRYGGFLRETDVPQRAGYNFKGWYMKDQTEKEWEFDKPAEENSGELSVTLYAKWEDETAPVLGEASFNEGYKNLLHQIIRKKDLLITIPVYEEGSGARQIDYALLPDASGAARTEGRAQLVLGQDGWYTSEIVISEEFKGRVIVSCTDEAGNTSPEKSVTAEDGRIIVEDNAPEISFSSGRERSFGSFIDTAEIQVSVEDEKIPGGGSRVSGGIADIFYRIDGGADIAASEHGFEDGLAVSFQFEVQISGFGEHTLSVTASDHAGNVNTQEITLEVQRRQGRYTVEHYLQNEAGDSYEKMEADTENLTQSIGTVATALPKAYTGFTENVSHPDRRSSGEVDEEGELILKLYYDRNSYEIGFDLNGGSGAAPAKQSIRYGTLLQAVEAPQRTGYTFKGWYMDKEGTDGRRWDFGKTAEQNTSSAAVTLYAKWVDETAPKLEAASYNNGYKTLFNYAIRQPTLFITVPILEEGSGVEAAAYTLMPEAGSPREGRAKIETKNGYTVAKISIKDNFKGAVTLSAVDYAGNVSAEKFITAKDGVIVEDNAPQISFSAKGGELPESFWESAVVDVKVSDGAEDEKISGGIARVSYQLDEGKVTDVKGGFGDALVEEYEFSVSISGENAHYLSVTAVDNAGNESSRRVKVELLSPQQAAAADGSPVEFTDTEPKTGDTSHMELCAAIALTAGFLYMLLLLCAGGEEPPEDELRKKLDRLSGWTKKGGRLRRMLAIAAVFFLLAYYHAVEKRALARGTGA